MQAFFAYEKCMYKVLFVCTGNICRSPTAEGVMRHAARERGMENQLHIDSAGTTGFHAGEAPDRRAIAHAKKRGFSLEGLRARKISAADFNTFDLILALDTSHLRELNHMQPKGSKAQVALFLDYAGAGDVSEVPDPYYGDAKHFEYVLDLIESGVKPLLDKLQQQFR